MVGEPPAIPLGGRRRGHGRARRPRKLPLEYYPVALLRFGHDPNPDVPGTTIPGDSSGLVDGVALELEWDDAQHVYQGCSGQELLDILAATPAPMQGMPAGIGAWTKGALDRALVEILQTRADHPEDEPGSRRELVVVIGSGAWTSADGQTELGPPSDDPTLTATALLDAKIETHVRTLDDGDGGPGDGDGEPGDGDPGDGDGDSGDGDGDPAEGDGDPGDSETDGTSSDGDGTGDDVVDIPIDNGCNCTTTPDARAWPTLLLLLGLGLRRRRQS